MDKNYEINNEEPMMANEPAISYGSISTADALWALIEQQARSVQLVIKERIDKLLSKQQDYVPYTIDELHSRLDESEMQMEQGDVIAGEKVHDDVRSLINSMAV